MHYPGHLRQAFESWIDAGRPGVATVEVNYEPQEVPAQRLLGMLWHCTDIMPSTLCGLLDMPTGTTYAAAAQELRPGHR